MHTTHCTIFGIFNLNREKVEQAKHFAPHISPFHTHRHKNPNDFTRMRTIPRASSKEMTLPLEGQPAAVCSADGTICQGMQQRSQWPSR